MVYRINKGLGDSPLNLNLGQGISTALSAGAPIGIAAYTGASLTVPIIGAAVAGVTLLIGAWLSSIAKHNAEKTAATAIVNQAEPYLKQNLAAFLSINNPNQAEKDQALSNFDNIWSQVVQACGNSQLEDAGKRCISDRSPGGQWNWTGYYRDPIANTVIQQTSSVESSVSDLVSSAISGNETWVIGGVAIVILAMVFSGKER